MIKNKEKSKKKKAENLSGGGKLYKSLTTVRFRKGKKIYELDMGHELLMYSEDHHTQIERISAVMGYFGSIVSLLEKEYEDKVALKKKVEGRIDKTLREAGITGEGRVIGAMKRHPNFTESQLEVNRAKANWTKAKNIYFSLGSKASVLHTRSTDIRKVPSDGIIVQTEDDIIDLN